MENIISKFIDDNKDNKLISFKSCLIIHGKSGVGKSFQINKICEDLNLEIIRFTQSNINNNNDFEDLIIKTTTTKTNVADIFNNVNNNKKKIIIVDDYDILITIDRTINSTLYNILNNKKIKNISIICICNSEILKKIGNIKKKCQVEEFKKPTKIEVKKILKKYKKISEKKLDEIINKIDGNIQVGINMINYETNDEIDTIIEAEYLYENNIEIENIIKILSSECWIVSLGFHENLINILKNRKSDLKSKNFFYKNFIIDFCYFDLFINKNIIDLAINIMGYNILILSKIEVKNKCNKINNNFTKLLSYLSLQKKNNKKGFIFNSLYYQIGSYHINSININLYS